MEPFFPAWSWKRRRGVNRQELELLPLGELTLALGVCPDAPILVGAVPEVLVPDRGVAPGLRALLRELGLTLRSGGTSLQTPDDWISRIQGSALALVVALLLLCCLPLLVFA